MVIQHERKFKILVSDESKIIFNFAYYKKSQGRGRGKGFSFIPSNKKTCTHCGRNGHTIDTCYRKHGFPHNFHNNTIMANLYSF